MVLEKTLENPLDCKEIKLVKSQGNQPWIFIGRTDVEAETPILWPPDVKNWLIEKTLMLGKIEGRRRRGWQKTIWCRMAPPTQWTWVWAGSGRWWSTEKAGVLQSMVSQKIGHDWLTEQQQNVLSAPSRNFGPRLLWERLDDYLVQCFLNGGGGQGIILVGCGEHTEAVEGQDAVVTMCKVRALLFTKKVHLHMVRFYNTHINLQYQYYTVLNFMYIADRIGFSLLAPGHNDYAKLHVN